MKLQQVIQQAKELGFSTEGINELQYVDKKSCGVIEVDSTYLDINYNLERRPRYRLTIKNKLSNNQIEIMMNMINYIQFSKDIRDKSVIIDYMTIKYPTLNEILLEIIELKKVGVYVKIEITDWNEISDEAWEVFYPDRENIQKQADNVMFNYHVVAIIDCDEEIIRVITDKEQINELYNIHDYSNC